MTAAATAQQGRVSAIRQTPLGKLRAHPENPRRITDDELARLMEQLAADPDMLRARPLIALPDGTVIAGNQRLAAAKALGWKQIPVATADVDARTAKVWMLRDNAQAGEWDPVTLADVLAGLDDVETALSGVDYSVIDGARTVAARALERGDPDEAPLVPAEPRSKRGEVYELGAHRVMCGDATDPDDVRALFGSPGHHSLDQVDAIWTDPPYGVGYQSVGRVERARRDGISRAAAGVKEIQNDQAEGLRELLAESFRQILGGLAPHARFYVAGPAGPRTADFLWAFDAVAFRLHQTLVWVKQRIVLGHSDYHYQHEPIFYGWATSIEWPGRPGRGKHQGSRWYGDNSQSSVLMFDAPARSDEHPTMKPVALIEQCLLNSTQHGDIVYDPFAGAGSTLIACDELGRRARLMEIDPSYCDVVRQRYADFVGQPELAP